MKYSAFNLCRQLALIVIMGLFSACSTVNTVKQPSVEDNSSQATGPAKPPVVTPTQKIENVTTNKVESALADQTNAVPVAPKITAPTIQNPAVVALIGTAQQQKQQGDLYSAQTSLQRAQRIAPRDPEVYYVLAGIHRELNDYDLAEQVALKGVSIVQGQPQQLHRFWSLIAKIRTDSGDRKGASQAQQIAERY